ncbi:hypothetical protein [Psychrobacter sanguinis]|uniref:Uncharacterized protein n=1 Tax=Psychrobacter sanguinis TaxID=861445 RepID=A0A844LZG1_9GAMM|nr:hypothetical protein [Psychrobacter sanguinis]MUG32081.1 hypothetical protein [Psychrobacter sanguinis]
MQNTVFTYDTDKFSSVLKEALKKDQVVFRDGVAYWKKGLESKGIIQHIPLKEVSGLTSDTFINTIGSLQSTLQNTILAAQTISTATIMIATIIQTQILSKKIDAVRSMIIDVGEAINEQNIIFYIDKVSEYLSTVQNLKLILETEEDIQTIEVLANHTLGASMHLKNHIYFFILSTLNLIECDKIKNNQHMSLILNFIQQMMELLPVGMHLEHLLSHRLGQYGLSQTLIEDSNKKYDLLLTQYRNYLNNINNNLRYFNLEPEEARYFEDIKQPALDLVKKEIHIDLLKKPALEQISVLK